MTKFPTLPALTFAIASTALFSAGIARADDAMKPAEPMATDAMKPADPMAADKMKADCMEKAAMETSSMKKDEATKACDTIGADAMKPAAN